jgi:hypothetical protein
MIMSNGIIINPTYDFKQPCRWHYQAYEGFTYESEKLTYGITYIQNFIKIRPDIL